MLRLFAFLGCMFLLAVGMWLYVAKPFPKGVASNNDDAAGVVAEQKILKKKRIIQKRTQKAVSRFAENPAAFFEPSEIIITSVDKDVASAAEIYGFRIIEQSLLFSLKSTLVRLRTPAGFGVKRSKRILASRFPTANVDANHHFRVQQATFKVTARPAANWTTAKPTCGRHLRIGLIDSTVNVNHPALLGQRIQFRSFHGEGHLPSPDGHGTAIAGVLVGKPGWGGLLPGAQLFAANIYGVRRDGKQVGSAASIARAIDWMVSNKVHVINLSIAGTNNKIVHNAIMKAERKGIAIVAAAGNWGRGGERAYPAAFTEVLAVSALTSDRKQLAPFSSTGDYIDFTAPGSLIWAPVMNGGGRYLSGTSFASPFVAALAATQTAKNPRLTAEKLRQQLSRQTVDMGAKGKDKSYGYGFLKLQPNCG